MGQRLAEARKAKGYTQRQMAEVFDITEVAWRNYEKGRELRSGMIVSICAVLECSPNWLLGVKETGMHLAPDSLLLKQLKDAFRQLNGEGQQEAVKRVQELTEIQRYTELEKKDASAGADA